MINFFIGYGAGAITMVGISGAAGLYLKKHPELILRKAGQAVVKTMREARASSNSQ